MSGMALWAEVLSSGQRNDGGATVALSGSVPGGDVVYNATANDEQVGFSTGTQHSNGYTLWSSTFSASNEYVPQDLC